MGLQQVLRFSPTFVDDHRNRLAVHVRNFLQKVFFFFCNLSSWFKGGFFAITGIWIIVAIGGPGTMVGLIVLVTAKRPSLRKAMTLCKGNFVSEYLTVRFSIRL